jgi:hypothetical protein
MLEVLAAPAPHVVAFRVGGKLTAREVERVFDALDDALDHHETVNLYAEITGLSGLTLEALVKDTAKSLGLLGRLKRFGRYAVVTDAKWIQKAAGIEDRLIPGLEIRAFPLVESESAEAWVTSRPG